MTTFVFDENETYNLLLDYCIFRMNCSSLKQSILDKFLCMTPSENARKMRFLSWRWAGALKSWPKLTNGQDFCVENYYEYANCFGNSLKTLKSLKPEHIYMYFEFTSVLCVSALSTPINTSKIEDICKYACYFLHQQEVFQGFIQEYQGWSNFLHKQYAIAKTGQHELFAYWLETVASESL